MEGYCGPVQKALCCGLPALVSRACDTAEQYSAELAELIVPDTGRCCGSSRAACALAQCGRRVGREDAPVQIVAFVERYSGIHRGLW